MIELETKTMRKEEIFNANGFYNELVRNNSLLHLDAIDHGVKAMAPLLERLGTKQSIKILDLACGAMPVTIAGIMERFPTHFFDYTGIDINSDQVLYADEYFEFSKNVDHTQLIEGDAWNLDKYDLDEFDIVYTGLNTQHGVPEEMYYLATQIYNLLREDGLFLNHDWFRPEGTKYLRRPDVDPLNSNNSFVLVNPIILESLSHSKFEFLEESNAKAVPQWKSRFIEELINVLRARGAKEDDLIQTREHVQARDFPNSSVEEGVIFEEAGFSFKRLGYEGSKEPLRDWFAMHVFQKCSV